MRGRGRLKCFYNFKEIMIRKKELQINYVELQQFVSAVEYQ